MMLHGNNKGSLGSKTEWRDLIENFPLFETVTPFLTKSPYFPHPFTPFLLEVSVESAPHFPPSNY